MPTTYSLHSRDPGEPTTRTVIWHSVQPPPKPSDTPSPSPSPGPLPPPASQRHWRQLKTSCFAMLSLSGSGARWASRQCSRAQLCPKPPRGLHSPGQHPLMSASGPETVPASVCLIIAVIIDACSRAPGPQPLSGLLSSRPQPSEWRGTCQNPESHAALGCVIGTAMVAVTHHTQDVRARGHCLAAWWLGRFRVGTVRLAPSCPVPVHLQPRPSRLLTARGTRQFRGRCIEVDRRPSHNGGGPVSSAPETLHPSPAFASTQRGLVPRMQWAKASTRITRI